MVMLLHKVWNQEIPKDLDNMLPWSFITVLGCLNEECVQHVDVVFDRHLPLSLKGDKRKGQGSGLRVSVRENKAIVWDRAKFLKGSSNKAELFHLIAEKITRNRTDHKMVSQLILMAFHHVIMRRPVWGCSCIWKVFLQQDISKYHWKLLIQALLSLLSVYSTS